jgi:hypothetical protein
MHYTETNERNPVASYCLLLFSFTGPLVYVNHIIARFIGRLKGNIWKNAGRRNVKADEKFGIPRFIRSLSVKSAQTNIFVRKSKNKFITYPVSY